MNAIEQLQSLKNRAFENMIKCNSATPREQTAFWDSLYDSAEDALSAFEAVQSTRDSIARRMLQSIEYMQNSGKCQSHSGVLQSLTGELDFQSAKFESAAKAVFRLARIGNLNPAE